MRGKFLAAMIVIALGIGARGFLSPADARISLEKCTLCHYKGNAEGAPQSDAYLEYFGSVHGTAIARGNAKAPLCQDCHGSHAIRKAKDPASAVARRGVAETCGRCHIEIYAQYKTSIHGVALSKQITEAPSCTGCHGEHKIYGHMDPKSTVFATHVAEQCSTCHASVAIMSKFGIDSEQVTTYQNSFHGVASKFGSRTVGNCASCHGIHDIRPPEYPVSMGHPKHD